MLDAFEKLFRVESGNFLACSFAIYFSGLEIPPIRSNRNLSHEGLKYAEIHNYVFKHAGIVYSGPKLDATQFRVPR